MTRYIFLAALGMVLATALVATAPARAQTAAILDIADETPITAKVDMGDEKDEPSEDPDRVGEGTKHQLAPEQYMESLRKLGVLDRLNTRGNVLRTKAAGDWQRVGPVGGFGAPVRNGRISGIQVLQDGSYYRVYAGACQGGLWRMRSQYWNQWTDIGYNLPNPSVRAFAVDPDDFAHIFVGTGDYERYTGAGMFETFDEGETWNSITLPFRGWIPEHFYKLKILGDSPTTGNRRMAAVTSMGPIWSGDGGVTWHRGTDFDTGSVLGFNWTDMVQHPDQPWVLFAVSCADIPGNASGFWVSTSSGEAWDRIGAADLPPSEDWSRASLAIADSEPARLAIMVTNGNHLRGVYRSDNGGFEWTDITGDLIVPEDDYSFGGNQVGHAQAITFKPDDANHIILGGVGLAKSMDAGATWAIGETETGIDYGHVDFATLSFDDVTGDDMMWMGNDGGIYYHRFNTGTTYQAIGDQTTGLACSEIDYMDAERNVVAIGLQDNGTLRSIDDAVTWDFIESGDGAEVEVFDAIAGDIFYNNGAYTDSITWHTNRLYYGSNKEFTNNPKEYMPRLYFSPFTGVLYTHDDTGVYTMNAAGALTWTPLYSNWLTLPYNIREMWSSWGGENTFWFNYWSNSQGSGDGNEDLTYVYFDGVTWRTKHWENFNPTGAEVVTVRASREWPDEAWVGLFNAPGASKIWHVRKGGTIQEDITNNLDQVQEVRTIEVMPFNPDVIWAGTDVGVYRTTDGGAHWEPFMNGLPVGRCSELHFVVDHTHAGPHHLVLSMDGRGVWKCEIDMPPILYVSGQTMTSGDGTIWGGVYQTVAEAVAVAPAGSIIAIQKDDYAEPQRIDPDVKLVTWRGNSRIH